MRTAVRSWFDTPFASGPEAPIGTQGRSNDGYGTPTGSRDELVVGVVVVGLGADPFPRLTPAELTCPVWVREGGP